MRDLVYPIGIVLEFVNGTDPNDIMYGQVWKKLPGGYHLLSTDNDSPSNSTTGDESNHIPGMAFKGGLPNIKDATSYVLYKSINGPNNNVFNAILGASVNIREGGMGSTNTEIARMVTLNFDASRGTSRYGKYQGNSNDNVIGNHIAAVMWKRVS